MWYFKELARFLAGFYGMFIAGAIHPVLGWLMVGVFFTLFMPRMWRASIVRKTERQVARKRRNIETQMMQGKLDAQLIREVADDMRDR